VKPVEKYFIGISKTVRETEQNDTNDKELHSCLTKHKAEQTKRTRRLFAALTTTLKQAKQNNEKRVEILKKRTDLEFRIQTKERQLLSELRRKEKEEQKKEAEENRVLKKKLVTEEKLLLMELDFVRELQREQHLAHFLRTKSTPRVFWMPKTVDGFLTKALKARVKEFEKWREDRTLKHEVQRSAYVQCREQNQNDIWKLRTEKVSRTSQYNEKPTTENIENTLK
jgi:hypothetical protein